MKNVTFSLAVLIMHMCVTAIYAQVDYNDIEYKDVYREYIEQKDISNLSTILSIGDTLYITSSSCVAEYMRPDTIWKKRVKKPKENKNYILQYIWNGVPTLEKSKSGFPIYTQSTYIVDGAYVYKGFESGSDGEKWIIVKDLISLRDIRFSAKGLNIMSYKINKDIYQRLTADSIYYVVGTGNREEDYFPVKIESVNYTIIVTDSNYVGDIFVETPDVIVTFENGKLDLLNHRIISGQEYKAFMEMINKDKIFLSLVVVKDCMTEGRDHYVKADTMALYKMEKKEGAFPWEKEMRVFYCYAYGNSYKFTTTLPYDNRTIQLLSPEDSTYLLNRESDGEIYRIKNAKKWDERNTWLLERDERWDKDTCILATIIGDDYSIELIDNNGYRKYDYSIEYPKYGTTIPVISYGKNEGDYNDAAFRVYYKGELFAVQRQGLQFKSDDESAYLIRRKEKGYKDRFIHAMAHDIVESFVEEAKAYERYNKKQIFYLEDEVYDSGYGWDGIKVKFYNCYKKTIKYIYCTFTAYNHFGDVQYDNNGRTTKDVRCIGPIEHGEGGTYSFDDIMNNKNEVISYYRPTKITIIFMDNSSVAFSGWNKIKPHTAY